MDWMRDHYDLDYKPNTRETVRRQTMHQFCEAAIAVANPDKPERAINSPKFCYQVSPEVLELLQSYGTGDWAQNLEHYLSRQQTLRQKYKRVRESVLVPVKVSDGTELVFSAGPHSELIRDIIERFGGHFAKGSTLLYAGDTGAKVAGCFEQEALAELGVEIDEHGKMPDVILYQQRKQWLFLIEAVTSHGPVDEKRYNELRELFGGADAGLVFVTAFPDRGVFNRYVSTIAWETEVWIADNPTHLIHFNGVRFLGPYDD